MILVFSLTPLAALMNDHIELTQTFSRSLIAAVLLDIFASAVALGVITLLLTPDIIPLLQHTREFFLDFFLSLILSSGATNLGWV